MFLCLYVVSPLDHLYFHNDKIDQCGNIRETDYYMKLFYKIFSLEINYVTMKILSVISNVWQFIIYRKGTIYTKGLLKREY
jgi:hypothetical protein